MDTSFIEKKVQGLICEKYSATCEKFSYIIANISKDLSQVFEFDGFFELDVETVCKILSNDDLQVVEEVDVFRVALKWITHIKEERTQYVSRIMDCVRFQHMSQKELMECLTITNSVKQSSLREVFIRANWSVTAAIVEAAKESLNVPSIGARTCLTNKPQNPTWPYFFSMHTKTFEAREFTEDKNYGKEEEVKVIVKSQNKPETRSFICRLRDLLCCFGRKKTIHKTFGTSLEELMTRAPHGAEVPTIVTRLCQYLNERGFEDEGIFRINGSQEVLKKLKKNFNKQGDAKVEKEKDIMAVAGLLKLFLRELETPVIPEHLTKKFVEIQKGHQGSAARYIFELRKALGELPQINFQLLEYIIRFLVPVSEKEAINKMGPKQLGIVFGPNFFRCGQKFEDIEDQFRCNDIIGGLIRHCTAIFGDEKERKRSPGLKPTPTRRPKQDDEQPPNEKEQPPKGHLLSDDKDDATMDAMNKVLEELKRKQVEEKEGLDESSDS